MHELLVLCHSTLWWKGEKPLQSTIQLFNKSFRVVDAKIVELFRESPSLLLRSLLCQCESCHNILLEIGVKVVVMFISCSLWWVKSFLRNSRSRNGMVYGGKMKQNKNFSRDIWCIKLLSGIKNINKKPVALCKLTHSLYWFILWWRLNPRSIWSSHVSSIRGKRF